MNPNEQPNQPQQPVNPYPPQQPPAPVQSPTAYPSATPQLAYDPNYLDSIAPPPPKASFLSGSFGKLFFVLIGVFVLAVSLIIAFSGKDNTADLQQIVVRLDDLSKTTKTVQKNLKSNNLSQTNTNLQIWMTNAQAEGETLLGQAKVKKTDYNKTMVASEKKIMTDLDAKFEDARLNATLGRVYASTMASETQKMINLYNTMAKKSKASAIREYAKNASANLTPIQKSFDSFKDDGN
ncbi:MAG: hypothetical protein JWN75_934 [Candidatus Saccharibacteria bacterium]|nr:hypothetical protein [Candidatus Saccharibacteria bacterium]